MTERHTPGPWRVFDAFKDLEIVTDRPTAHETQSLVQFKGQDNAAANARLMALAPEMFDALELCEDALSGPFPAGRRHLLDLGAVRGAGGLAKARSRPS